MNIPTPEQIRDYEKAPETVVAAVKGLRDAQLHFKPVESEWNIHEVVVHLADTEIILCERIKRIIVEEKPTLQPFDQDAWVKRLLYDQQDYRLALDLLRAQRKSTAPLLRLLPDDTWERKGSKEGKELTLFDAFITSLNHIPKHLKQIQNLKTNPNLPASSTP